MSLNTDKGRYKKERRAKNRSGQPVANASQNRRAQPYGGSVLYGARWDK
jgi:hypothetical protein